MREEELQKIPTASITKALTDSQIQCSVCLDQFHFNESGVRKLPCNHLYHEKCIFPWLQTNASCPYCRGKLPTTDLPTADAYYAHLDELGTLITTLRAAIVRRAGRAVILALVDRINSQNEQISNVQAPNVQRERIIVSDIGSQVSSMPASVNAHHSPIEQPSIERRQTHEGRSNSTHRTHRSATARARRAIQGIYRR